uniref:Ras-GEF domain-containing protein n=1 Tax=Arcella intermedia TaxID=1963864 RepID=A0A6B2L5K5_9EUKA
MDGYNLRAGTLNKIVEEITPPKNVNNTFVSLFLLTYRSFTTPEILLVKLRQRYDVPREENQEDQQYKEKALPIQLRVINVIKLWLDTCFNEMSNKFLLELKDFIDTKLMRDHVGQAKSILQILEKQEKLKVSSEKPNFIFNKPPEPPIIPKGGKIFLPELDWMDLDPQEIARQLTLIEFEMLYKIKPSEFLNQSWNKPKLRHNAKNILDYIDYFNKFSMWCSTRIIFPQKIKQRVKAWVKLIQVADHCYQLKNFNSLTALLSSFMTAPVFRLKHTKAAIPQPETDKWNELAAIMDMEGGFSRYRKELENTTSACIPYFGLFLTDLTFTEDGNMDEYKGLINWTKRKLIGQILQKIKNYQSTGFNIQPIYQIQQIFRVLKHRRTEEEQYADSLLREPRKADRSQIE